MKILCFLFLLISVSCQQGQVGDYEEGPSDEAATAETSGQADPDEPENRAETPSGSAARPSSRLRPESPPPPQGRDPRITVVLQEPGPSTLAFDRLEPGFELFQGSVHAGGSTVKLTAVRLVPRQHRLRVVASDGLKSLGHTLGAYFQKHNANAALSGGFLKSFQPPIPLGLVQINGRPLNRYVSSPFLSGLLLIRNGNPTIVPIRGPSSAAGWDDALQAGPLLLHDGKPALPKQSDAMSKADWASIEGAFTRAFIGIDRQGRTLLGITGQMTLHALVDLLRRPVRNGGLESRAALNLSGGENAGLLVITKERKIAVGDNYVRLPNAIVVQ